MLCSLMLQPPTHHEELVLTPSSVYICLDKMHMGNTQLCCLVLLSLWHLGHAPIRRNPCKPEATGVDNLGSVHILA